MRGEGFPRIALPYVRPDGSRRRRWLTSGGGRETELVPTSEVENIMLKNVDVDKAKRSDKGSDTSSRSSEEDVEMI